ncbi:hypothetical protein [Okeania sp. SIO3B5]|uniref:hypothetical protein n=1 Tax=Okeania sp. SIO3B5 TaxID=2607811 RepID=UPI0025CE742A|nr:hypothetical protein [Okeania sp. SIO3B5]
MNQTINVSGLKPEQIEQIQAIIEAFQAKNQLEILQKSQTKIGKDIIDYLTEKPIKVDGFLTRERLYLMQEAKGIWQDRENIPNLEELRKEFNR